MENQKPRIFVDTGAWIALTDRSDQYYQRAIEAYSRLKKEHVQFITTDFVIDETVTRLRYDSNYQIALRCLEILVKAEQQGILQILYVDRTIFAEASSLFRQYDTATLSFTDCVSFAICEMHKLQRVFGFDRHFTMRGISLYG